MEVQEARRRLAAARRVAVLTGAGVSAESGIPTFRVAGGLWEGFRPEELATPAAYARDPEKVWRWYAMRYAQVMEAEPNPAHRRLAELERQKGEGFLLVTQNVDGLHLRAGSRRVVELHGNLAEVTCLDCGAVEPRQSVQHRLVTLNPSWTEQPVEMAPDGDADLNERTLERFVVAECRACEGPLKPRVVFFGENVPRPVVEDAYGLLGEAEALLVVGSSLVVFSGYRFVRRASERGLPVAIVNLGQTRGDPLAQVVLTGRAGELLPRLAARWR